ncbi:MULTISPECIES: FtsW/RodA/SpoVE family cell cycle protein [unclassified Arthrobacter]|uniref:FtsW/RodA/SpoVE family cell cycle protein n=1 Tax=unclassified Arthrobacter TaxID=235627 RepID=UPI001E4A504A|nr:MULTISPECIES: FtsW/RodA/SpoVE family cell cycle protein [unclassified Arthrobacter]MCC9144246.1 FtsW/RodA/SpoVE family cell cycle protein [Arthrobacter sp. zg-Y919]MDK1275471.1 FtsW/RodA/SpoVE family cell cycle protein [Arthrobacter sp. zg.Y919]MDM7991103.1 FtsW/RodA/SpoVE family cell cycle protein [Arthrobacter sp. zg-Y877]WIB03150.1 FtsW/RodA/SpoVE family cell cycle protein [Arthrobacter sp. zg-Y919]
MSDVLTVSKPRRNIEALLLLVALLVGVGANMIVGLDEDRAFDSDFWVQGGTLMALVVIFHLVLRFRAKYADPVILPVVTALNGVGLAMIHRLDITEGTNAADRQLLWSAVAVAAGIAVLFVIKDHRILRRYTYISLIVSAVLLLLPLMPGLGQEINGARIWIRVGSNATFQPGEIAKITLAIFFAGYLSTNRDLILLAGRKVGPLQLPRMQDLGPMLAAWLVSIGVLVFQRDLGSSILFFGLFMAMIYVATSRVSWVLIGMGLLAVGGFVALQLFSHLQLRIHGWLNAFDPEVYNSIGGSHQVVQGLFGLASGGLVGTGLGQGRPDLVTFANSDMIIAALGEELGLIGIFAIVLLYVLLVSRGFRAALGTKDGFGKLLACGLSFTIALQCFVVIGGVTRLIPLTGLTTPFMSAGGSSLLANWIIVALLLMISDASRRPSATGPLATDMVPAMSEYPIGASTRGRRIPKEGDE